MNDYIKERLFSLKDEKYREFHARLMPSISFERIIGVRVPEVRRLAKELIKERKSEEFIRKTPHYYYEENNLHAFIIGEIKDFDLLISEIERFLPYVDNWATCDSMRPKAFLKNREKLLPYALKWMKSEEEFTVRFGIEVMMTCFLDDHFSEEYPRIISQIKSDKYYVNMMIAWYFATALSKHPDTIMPYIKERILPEPVHSMTVRKALDSYRVTENIKTLIKS